MTPTMTTNNQFVDDNKKLLQWIIDSFFTTNINSPWMTYEERSVLLDKMIKRATEHLGEDLINYELAMLALGHSLLSTNHSNYNKSIIVLRIISVLKEITA